MSAVELPGQATLEVSTIDTGELRVRTALENGGLTVHFAGSADSRSMMSIDGLLTKVHAEALRLAVGEVTADFRGFDFMNSSCFKAFVSWICRVEELDAAAQYKICFLSDEAKHWQRRSLDARKSFAVDLIRTET